MTNIAEILKNAPQGLKLYSLVHGEVTLNKVTKTNNNAYPIVVFDFNKDISTFTKYGQIFATFNDAECVLFPSKEHKSWDNWQEVLFQRGDVITASGGEILLFNSTDYAFTNKAESRVITKGIYRYATPEERDKFFKELNTKGYKWNADTKQIEIIEQQNTPKYKVGDYIIRNSRNLHTIAKVNEIVTHIGNVTYYRLFYFDSSCTGDYSLKYIESNFRLATEQELINADIKEKQFKVNSLKPFDKVLVRNYNDTKWVIDLFAFYDYDCNDRKYIVTGGFGCKYCIPYNDETKNLLGTSDDCPDKYKTW